MIGRNSMSQRIVVVLTLVLAPLCPALAMAAPPAHAAKPAAKAKPAAARKPVSTGKPAGDVRPAPRNNTWALLVGVSKYQNPAILSLRYPSSDATALRDAL